MRLLLAFWLSLMFSFVHCQVTYYKDIAPILDKHCTSCHSSGDIGPMSLTKYDEVASYANMIKFVTDTKLMPPFKASTRSTHYQNERKVSEEDKRLIAQWIENGLEKGQMLASLDLPEPTPVKKDFDYTICMDESFEHYGIYYDQYQAFVLPVDLDESKYISEIFFHPGNKEIVRSANISVAQSEASSQMDNWDPRYGFFAYGSLGFISSFPNWYNWMPHTPCINLNKDEQLYLPSGTELIMHIHYGPFGEVQSDSSCIHMNFSDTASTVIQNIPFIKPEFLDNPFRLEAGKKHRILSSFTLPVETKLRSISPLSHLLCRSWEVFAVLPDKSSMSLLSIEDWDFHWKEKYVFEEPITLPPGTRIHASAVFDNSYKNPYNPSTPPHDMIQGPHMYDENFECYFEILPPSKNQGHIQKTFITNDQPLKELSFYIVSQDTVNILIHDLDSLDSKILTSKFYVSGSHTIKSSTLPSKKGRYCISLKSSFGVIDNWWFVLL